MCVLPAEPEASCMEPFVECGDFFFVGIVGFETGFDGYAESLPDVLIGLSVRCETFCGLADEIRVLLFAGEEIGEALIDLFLEG